MNLRINGKEGDYMSLFDGQSTPHSKEQQRKVTMAELAGAGIGLGTGAIAGALGNIKYRENARKDAFQQSKDLDNSEENWRKMIDLHTGKMKFKDMGERERRRFVGLLDENKDDLDYLKEHPNEVEPLLKDMKRGQVIPLFPDQAEPSKVKQIIEEFTPKKVDLRGENVKPLFADEEMIPHIMENPVFKGLPPLLGLAGMTVAGMMARKHFDKQNESHKDEHDLNRLQELLDALKAKESNSNH